MKAAGLHARTPAPASSGGIEPPAFAVRDPYPRRYDMVVLGATGFTGRYVLMEMAMSTVVKKVLKKATSMDLQMDYQAAVLLVDMMVALMAGSMDEKKAEKTDHQSVGSMAAYSVVLMACRMVLWKGK